MSIGAIQREERHKGDHQSCGRRPLSIGQESSATAESKAGGLAADALPKAGPVSVQEGCIVDDSEEELEDVDVSAGKSADGIDAHAKQKSAEPASALVSKGDVCSPSEDEMVEVDTGAYLGDPKAAEGKGADDAVDKDIEITHTSHAMDGKEALDEDDDWDPCIVCGSTQEEGMMVCRKCNLSAHSWCYYRKGSKAEGDSISLGDAWSCGSCGGPPQETKNRNEKVVNGNSPQLVQTFGVASRESEAGSKAFDKRDAKKLLEEAGYWYQGGSLMKKSEGKSRQHPTPTQTSMQSTSTSPIPRPADGVATSAQVENGAGNYNLASVGSSRAPSLGMSKLAAVETRADQKALAELLAGEATMLKKEKNRLKASTEAVTDDMMTDVQQLLEILGVPYVLGDSSDKWCLVMSSLRA